VRERNPRRSGRAGARGPRRPCRRAGARRRIEGHVPGKPDCGRVRPDRDRDCVRRTVLLRRGRPPRAPRHESERLWSGLQHRCRVPDWNPRRDAVAHRRRSTPPPRCSSSSRGWRARFAA